jgi:protein-tyrosine phosphatase
MIDLHCHLLPGIDDGAGELAVSLDMARMAAADGITTIACTPHILPGVYNNDGAGIDAAIERLRAALADAGIAVRLVAGADAHVSPDLIAGLSSGRVPTLNGSRYFLLEPPHHVLPPRFEEEVFAIRMAGYTPILTHPERLGWIEPHYGLIQALSRKGLWIQVTAGSLSGHFGRRARYWSERLLDDGLVQLLASDAHNAGRRPPILSVARDIAAKRLGDQAATSLVVTYPQSILDDIVVSHNVIGDSVAELEMTLRPGGGLWRRMVQYIRRD